MAAEHKDSLPSDFHRGRLQIHHLYEVGFLITRRVLACPENLSGGEFASGHQLCLLSAATVEKINPDG
jgi:hypothetical protein